MLTSLLLSLAPVQGLQATVDADEMRKRRITPTVSVVQAASPAVVYIQTGATVLGRDIFGRIVSREFGGAGSGVVIRKEGFIITNYHVVRDADRITVSFDKAFDDTEYKANLVSYVEDEDLALLKIAGDRVFPTIPLGRSHDLMPGETVVAIGNPYGQTITVTGGIISGLHRNVPVPQSGGGVLQFPDLIQTDASINPGNSGGPLLNVNGELIGINTAMNMQAQNIGFAIPVDRVRSVLENQLLSPETAPAWLGFEIEPGDHLCIARVVPGSPARRPGSSRATASCPLPARRSSTRTSTARRAWASRPGAAPSSRSTAAATRRRSSSSRGTATSASCTSASACKSTSAARGAARGSSSARCDPAARRPSSASSPAT
jgi:S1-C subfamily serine protease